MTFHYRGGYYLHNDPLVRGAGFNAHTANDLSNLSPYTIQAVNHLQATPWQVNRFVLDLVSRVKDSLANLTVPTNQGPEVVLRVIAPSDPRTHHKEFVDMPVAVWKALPQKEKDKKTQIRHRLLKQYESELASLEATERIIKLAGEMSRYNAFYFPHNMDFRLRMYPIPTDLTPQSNDLSKGLLRFSQGTRLGKDGYFWLGVMTATHFGEDKLSMKQRFAFAKKMLKDGEIQKWIEDPYMNQGWLKADAPFLFLATAHEWVMANYMEFPEDFISFVPGNLDGSCNGAQHLSIMARDLVGATATNCRNLKKRHDLYQEVGDRVYAVVLSEASEGNLDALEWVEKLSDPKARRKLVKRSVMTVPYGVTEYGIATNMIEDGHVDESMENRWNSAKYMRDKIWAAIDETLSQGRKLQEYFKLCAILCAKAGRPLIWDTPAGSKVTQAYRKGVERRIQTLNTRFIVYSEPKPGEDDDDFLERIGIDEKKAGTSAPPNVVHSCDAAHAQITVVRCYDAGIRLFSFVHDSFGCPMAQMGLMRDILRQAAVDMYEDDYLGKWRESVQRYTGLSMPFPPKMGTFDINEILESEYFFS